MVQGAGAGISGAEGAGRAAPLSRERVLRGASPVADHRLSGSDDEVDRDELASSRCPSTTMSGQGRDLDGIVDLVFARSSEERKEENGGKKTANEDKIGKKSDAATPPGRSGGCESGPINRARRRCATTTRPRHPVSRGLSPGHDPPTAYALLTGYIYGFAPGAAMPFHAETVTSPPKRSCDKCRRYPYDRDSRPSTSLRPV